MTKQRGERIGLRLSTEERAEIGEQAEVSGLSVSEYVRRRVWGRRVASKVDLKVLAELRRLGGLLKHIHNETRGAYSELTADAIRAIEAYSRTLIRRHNEKKNNEVSP